MSRSRVLRHSTALGSRSTYCGTTVSPLASYHWHPTDTLHFVGLQLVAPLVPVRRSRRVSQCFPPLAMAGFTHVPQSQEWATMQVLIRQNVLSTDLAAYFYRVLVQAALIVDLTQCRPTECPSKREHNAAA